MKKFDYYEDMLDFFEGKESKYKYPEPIELSVYEIVDNMDFTPYYGDEITEQDINKAYFKPYLQAFLELNNTSSTEFNNDDFIRDYNYYMSESGHRVFDVDTVQEYLYNEKVNSDSQYESLDDNKGKNMKGSKNTYGWDLNGHPYSWVEDDTIKMLDYWEVEDEEDLEDLEFTAKELMKDIHKVLGYEQPELSKVAAAIAEVMEKNGFPIVDEPEPEYYSKAAKDERKTKGKPTFKQMVSLDPDKVAKFESLEEDVSDNVATKGVFNLDDEPGVTGYTLGEKWKGWECPAFEKEIADKIMDDFNKDATDPLKMEYIPEEDLYRISGDPSNYFQASENDDEDDAPYSDYVGFDINTEDGVKHVYQIGNGEWPWQEIKSPTEEDVFSSLPYDLELSGEEELRDMLDDIINWREGISDDDEWANALDNAYTTVSNLMQNKQ